LPWFVNIFRDESLTYAQRLSRAGVSVEFHLRPGVPHEFETFAYATDIARRSVADRLRVLRSDLTHADPHLRRDPRARSREWQKNQPRLASHRFLPTTHKDTSPSLDQTETKPPSLRTRRGPYTVLVTGDDTPADSHSSTCMSHPARPPPHRHDFEEMFTVLEGEVELSFRGPAACGEGWGDRQRAGQRPHGFRNASTEAVRLLCLCVPGGTRGVLRRGRSTRDVADRAGLPRWTRKPSCLHTQIEGTRAEVPRTELLLP